VKDTLSFLLGVREASPAVDAPRESVSPSPPGHSWKVLSSGQPCAGIEQKWKDESLEEMADSPELQAPPGLREKGSWGSGRSPRLLMGVTCVPGTVLGTSPEQCLHLCAAPQAQDRRAPLPKGTNQQRPRSKSPKLPHWGGQYVYTQA
jgi:hypothetical protein